MKSNITSILYWRFIYYNTFHRLLDSLLVHWYLKCIEHYKLWLWCTKIIQYYHPLSKVDAKGSDTINQYTNNDGYFYVIVKDYPMFLFLFLTQLPCVCIHVFLIISYRIYKSLTIKLMNEMLRNKRMTHERCV